MKYYQEITILPSESERTDLYFLWSKLYTQLHLALVETQNASKSSLYGFSFPQYAMQPEKKIGFLGSKVRVFAENEMNLQALDLAKWLARLTDYVHLSSIRVVPQNQITNYACYYRVVPKMSLEQRILHQAKRRGISVEEARAYFQDYQETKTAEPFVQLNSLTNGHSFRLYIGKTFKMQPQSGSFSVYGLSRETTVPEFA